MKRSELKKRVKRLRLKTAAPAIKADTSSISFGDIKKELRGRVTNSSEVSSLNRAKAKNELSRLGFPNISSLPPQYREEFYNFILTLPLD